MWFSINPLRFTWQRACRQYCSWYLIIIIMMMIIIIMIIVTTTIIIIITTTTIIIVERRRSQKWRFQGCFSWLREWTTSQTHSTIARAFLNYTSRCYQQNTSPESEVLFRLWGNFPGSIPHVLAGCPALAQNKYLSRHNAALEILFLKLDEISWWCATLVFTSEAEACMRTAKHKYFGTFQCMQTITKWELIESMLK